ncbi:unnamed protein product [Darwinula stevensoni]|uniref:Uncharacterized protein n=1 Tax=Darwinula stevensoni TaxID=69355 RepID=A0A7R8WYH3_9CRUS|nr:unnamed protein product [Darwinula stevensoni]CAG0878961.1 unnamed protein product [Darwinula stevensoni]
MGTVCNKTTLLNEEEEKRKKEEEEKRKKEEEEKRKKEEEEKRKKEEEEKRKREVVGKRKKEAEKREEEEKKKRKREEAVKRKEIVKKEQLEKRKEKEKRKNRKKKKHQEKEARCEKKKKSGCEAKSPSKRCVVDADSGDETEPVIKRISGLKKCKHPFKRIRVVPPISDESDDEPSPNQDLRVPPIGQLTPPQTPEDARIPPLEVKYEQGSKSPIQALLTTSLPSWVPSIEEELERLHGDTDLDVDCEQRHGVVTDAEATVPSDTKTEEESGKMIEDERETVFTETLSSVTTTEVPETVLPSVTMAEVPETVLPSVTTTEVPEETICDVKPSLKEVQVSSGPQLNEVCPQASPSVTSQPLIPPKQEVKDSMDSTSIQGTCTSLTTEALTNAPKKERLETSGILQQVAFPRTHNDDDEIQFIGIVDKEKKPLTAKESIMLQIMHLPPEEREEIMMELKQEPAVTHRVTSSPGTSTVRILKSPPGMPGMIPIKSIKQSVICSNDQLVQHERPPPDAAIQIQPMSSWTLSNFISSPAPRHESIIYHVPAGGVSITGHDYHPYQPSEQNIGQPQPSPHPGIHLAEVPAEPLPLVKHQIPQDLLTT